MKSRKPGSGLRFEVRTEDRITGTHCLLELSNLFFEYVRENESEKVEKDI